MATNAWGLPENEMKQMKGELGIAAVSPAPVAKPARKKAVVPGIADTPDMKSYRFMNAQELANEGAGPVTGSTRKKAIPGIADSSGTVQRNAYIVGEQGPELFIPSIDGTIVPNPATVVRLAGKRALGGKVSPFDDGGQLDEIKNPMDQAVLGPVGTNARAPIEGPVAGTAPATAKKISYQDLGGIGELPNFTPSKTPTAKTGSAHGYEGSLLLDPAARKSAVGFAENLINDNGIGRKPGTFSFSANSADQSKVTPGATPAQASSDPLAKNPAVLSNIGASAALGAAGGDPAISTALKNTGTDSSALPVAPVAALPDPAIDDPGSGSALIGGKKIKYQDIGGIGDPLKAGWDGSGKVAGQSRNSNSIIDGMIARQDQGIVSQAYKDQVANAVRVNAANGMAPTAEQMKTLGMSNTDLVGVLTSNNKDGRYDSQITDLQKQQLVDQQGQKLAIDSKALENDLAYRNKVLAIDAPLKDAQSKQYLSEAKKNDLMSTPEYLKAAGKDKGDEQRYKLMEKLIGTNENLYGKILDGIRQHPEGMNLPAADQEKFARDKAWEATLQSFSNVGGLFTAEPEEGAKSGPNKTLQGAVVALRAAQEGIEKRKAAGQINEKQANAEYTRALEIYNKIKTSA